MVFLIFLIWISQVLRLLDIKFSITEQFFDIILATTLLLPSFINPLLPILLLISFVYYNFILTSSGELLILNQYLGKKDKLFILLFLKIFILIFYILNNEILSPNTYKMYKTKEIEIRNNLKIGIPKNNELHLDHKLSLFFQNRDNYLFFNVESILYENNEFIKSEFAEIEYDKNGFNIIFTNGQRVIMNQTEKSKTQFEKFVYNFVNQDIEEVLEDKEHFNTFELLKHIKSDFLNQGHNRIINYMILFLTLILSTKIIFKINDRKINTKINLITVLLFLLIYIVNAFLLYNLNNNQINIISYYLIHITVLLTYLIFIIKIYDTK